VFAGRQEWERTVDQQDSLSVKRCFRYGNLRTLTAQLSAMFTTPSTNRVATVSEKAATARTKNIANRVLITIFTPYRQKLSNE
jgi:hypothetical protein